MSTFKAFVLKTTHLHIKIPALDSTKHLLKCSGPSSKGDFYKSTFTLDHLMWIFKTFVIDSIILGLKNPALISRMHLLKFSVHSTKVTYEIVSAY